MKILLTANAKGDGEMFAMPDEWQAIRASSDGIKKTFIRSWLLSTTIEARQEIWRLELDNGPNAEKGTPITACYVKGTDAYVGDLTFARYLVGKCIVPELKTPESNVCSVGFSKPFNSWAGWSHRAMCLFTLGNRVFEERYGDDNTLFTEHGPTVIETMEQARAAAVAFADYVS